MLTLRPYQEAAVGSIFRYYEQGGQGNVLIVVPTGGGKSLILAEFIRRVLASWPDQRLVMVTHVKELIQQNYLELRRQWPEAPVGIYSAGLSRRDAESRVVFCGIQSVHRRARDLQWADLVLVDEAHLIPRKTATMYGRFLRDLRSVNPRLKVIGLTATPYRLDSGLLTEGEGPLFDDVAHEVPLRELVEGGFLAPLRSKATVTSLNVAGVRSRGGDYIQSELQRAVDVDEVTAAIVDELVEKGADRRQWLVFCTGVEHGQHVAQALRARGIPTECVFGETPPHERTQNLVAFQAGALRCLVSMGVLTTGFNAPGVDLIALLRPTQSAGLYVQMMGRGMRVAEGKADCLVLDFGGNVRRHGPVDAVEPRSKGAGGEGDGEVPTKTCPECREIVAIATRACPACDAEFPPPAPAPLDTKPSTAHVLSFAEPEWVDVESVDFYRHEKVGGTPSLRVEYECGLTTHREWVCLEHGGFPREKACRWWQQMGGGTPVPASVNEALARVQELAQVLQISVAPDPKKPKYTRVMGVKLARAEGRSRDGATTSESSGGSIHRGAGARPPLPWDEPGRLARADPGDVRGVREGMG